MDGENSKPVDIGTMYDNDNRFSMLTRYKLKILINRLNAPTISNFE
jgi:hypothetical protein